MEIENKIELQEVIRNDGMKERRVGIFWDIDNCQIPRGISAKQLVRRIVNVITGDHIYGSIDVFYCCCDSKHLTKRIIDELKEEEVDILEVNPNPNPTDYKLMDKMTQFVQKNPMNGTNVVLISGDSHFKPILEMAKTRGSEVTLIYRKDNCAQQLCNEDITDRFIDFDSVINGLKTNLNTSFYRKLNRNKRKFSYNYRKPSVRKSIRKRSRNRKFNSETIDSNHKSTVFTEEPKRSVEDRFAVCDRNIVNSYENQSIGPQSKSKCEYFEDICCCLWNCIFS